MQPPADIRNQYEALTADVGVCDLGGRTQVELTGADRSTFLHGMCTNEIQKLSMGGGCEAFLTNVQGKTIAYVYVFCLPSSLVLDTVAGQAETIIAALDRYIIREDVELHDRSSAWSELLVAGPRAEALLGELLAASPPQRPLAHLEGQIAGTAASVRRVPFAGPSSFFVSCAAAQREACLAALQQAGAAVCGPAAVEILRIEAGTPRFGTDLNSDNLPQEVNRNQQAISFIKGCYLGQETVARIDALGHVNRTLSGLRFESPEVPPAGTQLTAGEKTVARVTSASWSFKWNAPLALAYVRRGHSQPGTTLASPYGEAEVVALGEN